MNLRNNFIKIICIVLSLLVVLVTLGGCKKEEKKKKKIIKKVIVVTEEDSSETSSDNFESTEDDGNYAEEDEENFSEEENNTSRVLRPRAEKKDDKEEKYVPEYDIAVADWAGPEGYVIVIADGNKNSKNIAEILQNYFDYTAGIKISIVTDKTAETANEILVGNTNRYISTLPENEYAVKLKGSKLVFEGGHYAMVEKAVDWYSCSEYQAGKTYTMTGKCKDFVSTVKDGYKYVWGDEFSGSALDMTKWSFDDRFAGTPSMPLLTDENVINVNEDKLKLAGIRYFNQEIPTAQYATLKTVCTQDAMSYKYGYIEIKAMVPYIRGAWPSFWFCSRGAIGNANKPDPIYSVEVDVFEIFSSTNTAKPNIHKWYTIEEKDAEGKELPKHAMFSGSENPIADTVAVYKFFNKPNLAKEYHVYGFEWTPDAMIMSIDGEDYMTFDLNYNFDGRHDMSGFHQHLFPMFNVGMYVPDLAQTTGKNMLNNSDLPFEYFIEYIRLYQKDGVGELTLAK